MKNKSIDQLILALNETLNAECFWLTLNMDINHNSWTDELVDQLQNGSFHDELAKADLALGFHNYSEWSFPKDSENPILVRRPGNVWNGNKELTTEVLTHEELQEILVDILSGGGKHFPKTKSMKSKTLKQANTIVQNFILSLETTVQCTIEKIEPNFLYTMEDEEESDFSLLSYFENANRDLAIAFVVPGEINILLTNGYF